MILYVENSKQTNKQTFLEEINEYIKVAQYKVHFFPIFHQKTIRIRNEKSNAIYNSTKKLKRLDTNPTKSVWMCMWKAT